MDTIVPVILAGGSGSRLWPLSRSSSPKQLLNILGDNSLLQETLLRCNKISKAAPIIIYNKEYHFQVIDQIGNISIPSARNIVEPIGRNTCPAIAIAALEAQINNEDPLLFVLPADHFLKYENEEQFIKQISAAVTLANQGFLVTFGIIPRSPETGYGYIKMGSALIDNEAYSVDKFIEKPEKETAIKFLKDKKYLWNSGMFFFRASVFLKELKQYAPQILDLCQKSHAERKLNSGCTYISSSFKACPSISIDYAVMEHTKNAAIIPVDAEWSDIGSWSSLFDLQKKNEDGNVIEGDVIVEKSKNCYIRSSSRLVATVGLTDHIVIETRDSVLVAHKSEAQQIKKIVDKLNSDERVEALNHYQVYRPWGSYELLIDLPNYKVKRLIVKKGCSLSLQRHKHRSEHWVVVSGVATIINDDAHLVLYPSQSTYIPQGAKHRLSNFSDQLLELIEVQIGDYLGEDDIERFDDLYGRNQPIFEVVKE